MDAMRKTVTTANENINCFVMFSKSQLKPGEVFRMIRTKRGEKNSAEKISETDTLSLLYESAADTQLFSYRGIQFGELLNMEAVFRFNFIMDSTASENQNLKSDSGITFNNFREKLSDSDPIYKKYDTVLVDSLLKFHLGEYSITDKFHFAYINTDKKQIEFNSHSSLLKKFYESSLKQQLTNDRYFTQPYDLVIYFDNNDRLIFTSIRTVLILSALVIVILLISFYIFIRIVYKQRKLSELKNDFVNNMTHEFKTPLANISLVLETLSEKDFSETKSHDKVLKILGQETERLRENIEKILQVARFEKEKIHLSFELLDIQQVIQNAVSSFDVAVSSKNVEISYDFNATNPYVFADETHLINVISNLVDNAIKYSRKPAQINISTRSNSQGIFFSIRDNGQGISREAQKRVFDKFYREPNGNVHTIKGFGLGLSYVKSIVESHHGKIYLTSHVGTGSEFEIYLPLNSIV